MFPARMQGQTPRTRPTHGRHEGKEHIMNTTDTRALRRLAGALGLAALSATAALSLGAGAAAADRGVCECADGKHTPHSTVPGLNDIGSATSGGGAGLLFDLILAFQSGGHGSLTANHSLTTARARRSVGH